MVRWLAKLSLIAFGVSLCGCVDNSALVDSLSTEKTVTVNEQLTVDSGIATAVSVANSADFHLTGECTKSENQIEVTYGEDSLGTSACTGGKFDVTVDFTASTFDGVSALTIAEKSATETVSTLVYTLYIDLAAPTVVQNMTVPSSTVNPLQKLSIEFNEKVTIDFTQVSLTNAIFNPLTLNTPDQITYNFDIASDSSGTSDITFPEGSIKDLAGNILSGDVSANWSYSLPPPASLPSAVTKVTPTAAGGSDQDVTIDVTVTSIEGQTVKLYNATDTTQCLESNLLATVTTDSTTAQFNVTHTTEATYNYRAVASTITGTSACSTATASYSYDLTPPTVLGLSDDTTPTTSKNWVWTCDEPGCTYRYVIDANPTTTPTGAYGGTSVANIAGVDGLRYIHVQAKDAAGLESSVVHVSAILILSTKSPPSLLQLNNVDPTDNDPTPDIAVFGVLTNDEVRVYTDNLCQNFVGVATATGTSVVVTTSALTEGDYTFYATGKTGGDQSACSSASVDYTYTPISEASSLTLNDPVSSPSADSTPTIDVGVTSSPNQTVRLYKADSTFDCTGPNLIGTASGSASTVTVAVTSALPSSGTYTIRAVTESALGATMPCSTANLSYVYDTSPPTVPSITITADDANAKQASSITWNASTDSLAGMSHYEIGLSTSSDPLDPRDILEYTNIGNVLTYQLTDVVDGAINLTPGSTYYAHVRAVDLAGNQSAADTSGAIVPRYLAVNVGNSTSTAVVTLDDSNTVKRNGSNLTTLTSATDRFSFSASSGDRLTSDKAFYVAGEDSSGNQNVTWNSVDWAGTSFAFANYRSSTSTLRIYALADADITITKGGGAYATLNVSKNSIGTQSINQDTGSSYELSSTAPVLLFHSASTDPFAILPASDKLIGFKSNSLRISTNANSNLTVTDSAGASQSPTVNLGTIGDATVGTGTLFTGPSVLISSATSTVAARAEADSNGSCAASFIPTSQMKKRYAINVGAEWVTFAAESAVTVTVTPPTGSPYDVVLSGSGPYKHRLTSIAAGTMFEATTAFAAWYEPNTSTDAANDDETLMFGHD